MAKVSIIVPVYNVEKYLDVCLDSILNQSFRDFEVICVNDGSTDSSPEILDKYSKFDRRIKVYHKENGGVSDARNFGMKKISGKYTMFVDSDDWLSHVALERLYKNIVEYDSDFNYCGVVRINNITRKNGVWLLYNLKDFERYVKEPYFNPDTIPPELIYKMHVMTWGKLYKTEFIKDFKFQKGMAFEDNYYFTECYLSAKRISYDHTPLYYYRVNLPNSIVTNYPDKYKDFFTIADMIKDLYYKHSKFEKYKTSYSIYYYSGFFYYTAKIKDEKERKLAFQLLKEKLEQLNIEELDKNLIKEKDLFKTAYSTKDMNYQEFIDLAKKGGYCE